MAKIKTSIPHLDTELKGGITQNEVTVVMTKPGVDISAFALQIADSCASSSKVFYLTNTKNPTTIQNQMKEHGFKAALNFIDAYSSLVGAKSKSSLVVVDPKNPEEIMNDLGIICKKFKNPTFIFDSLSTFFDQVEKEDPALLEGIKNLKATVVCTFTDWGYPGPFLKKLKEHMNTIIEVSSVQEKLFQRSYFGVSKVDGAAAKAKPLPFRVEKPGGIKLYVPKILVTGPFNAGKTSMIHSSSEKAVSVDRLGTTVALDHGHVKYKGFSVDLFGTPGQQRFDPILKILGGESLGVIVVVSATDPEGYPRAIEMMKKAKVYGLPVVFAANKANLRGALSPEQVKERLQVEDVVIPITAKDLSKVQPGLPCQLNQKDIEKVLDEIFGKLFQKR